MKLSDTLKKVTVVASTGNMQREITGVNIDSRQVKPGDLFIAVKGTQADGHVYIPKAIEQGAVAILMSEALPTEPVDGITYVQVATPLPDSNWWALRVLMVKLLLPRCCTTCSAPLDISVDFAQRCATTLTDAPLLLTTLRLTPLH